MTAPIKQYRLRVNGKDVAVSGRDKRLLMDVLREDLRLTGSKDGCTQGYCGSCRVILNGKAVNSCTTTLRVADGGEVTTIEGVGSPTAPHPRERAFQAENLYVAPKTDPWGQYHKEDYKTHVTYGYGAQVAIVTGRRERSTWRRW